MDAGLRDKKRIAKAATKDFAVEMALRWLRLISSLTAR